MAASALFDDLSRFDTPTICNALEIVRGQRFTSGFTRQRLLAAFPTLPPIVGYAKTARLRCSVPFDSAARRQKLLGYYEYVAQPKQPAIAVVEDIDSQPGLGAFWGEVNTTVHWGLGCHGAVTNGSMRDLGAMCPQFQCLAATLSPSHVNAQVVEFGTPVEVFGMAVSNGDIVHADRHGAVVFTSAEGEKLPAAIDLIARRERVILDAARKPGFNVAVMREAMAVSDKVT
jgi:regulator of RNase E activity RraA